MHKYEGHSVHNYPDSKSHPLIDWFTCPACGCTAKKSNHICPEWSKSNVRYHVDTDNYTLQVYEVRNEKVSKYKTGQTIRTNNGYVYKITVNKDHIKGEEPDGRFVSGNDTHGFLAYWELDGERDGGKSEWNIHSILHDPNPVAAEDKSEKNYHEIALRILAVTTNTGEKRTTADFISTIGSVMQILKEVDNA